MFLPHKYSAKLERFSGLDWADMMQVEVVKADFGDN